jgi:hypothetical protein
MAGVVKHRAFRDIEGLVTDANDAALGLLVGERIARANLDSLNPSDAEKQLSQLFTGKEVEDISRFDFRVPVAISKLAAAERELSVMAVPFAVSLYNEYLVAAAQLLELAHVARPPEDAKRMFLGKLEDYLRENGVSVGGDWAALVRFIREVRNCIVHGAGATNDAVINRATKLPPKALESWATVTGRPIPLGNVGERISWEGPEIRGVFLVIRQGLSRINKGLQAVLPREFWADLFIHELWTDGHNSTPPSRSGSSLINAAKAYGYGSLALEPSELRQAIVRFPTIGWRPDLLPYWQRTIPGGSPVSQPVSAADLTKGRIRIPAPASPWFPSSKESIRLKLREENLTVEFLPPRTEGTHGRSGVLLVGPQLRSLVVQGQTLSVFRISRIEIGLQ